MEFRLLSIFCEKSVGKARLMSSKSCVFPPIHFTNGFADVYVLLLIFSTNVISCTKIINPLKFPSL